MLLFTLGYILFSALSWLDYKPWISWEGGQPSSSHSPELLFELRHVHAVSPEAHVVWGDISHLDTLLEGRYHGYHARTRSMKAIKPSSPDAFHRARALSKLSRQSASLDWDEDDIQGPNVEDRETLLDLAKMTNNAYLEPGEAGWYDLGGDWNVVSALFPLSLP